MLKDLFYNFYHVSYYVMAVTALIGCVFSFVNEYNSTKRKLWLALPIIGMMLGVSAFIFSPIISIPAFIVMFITGIFDDAPRDVFAYTGIPLILIIFFSVFFYIMPANLARKFPVDITHLNKQCNEMYAQNDTEELSSEDISGEGETGENQVSDSDDEVTDNSEHVAENESVANNGINDRGHVKSILNRLGFSQYDTGDRQYVEDLIANNSMGGSYGILETTLATENLNAMRMDIYSRREALVNYNVVLPEMSEQIQLDLYDKDNYGRVTYVSGYTYPDGIVVNTFNYLSLDADFLIDTLKANNATDVASLRKLKSGHKSEVTYDIITYDDVLALNNNEIDDYLEEPIKTYIQYYNDYLQYKHEYQAVYLFDVLEYVNDHIDVSTNTTGTTSTEDLTVTEETTTEE